MFIDKTMSTTGTLGSVEVIVLDDDGVPVFDVDDAGKAITEQLPRAVILKPTTADACDAGGDTVVNDKNERSGAPIGFGMLIIFVVGLFVRKVKK